MTVVGDAESRLLQPLGGLRSRLEVAADDDSEHVVAGAPIARLEWERTLLAATIGLDAVAALLATISAFLVRWGPDGPTRFLVVALCVPLAWTVLLGAVGAYDRRFLGVGTEEFRRVGQAGVILTAGAGFLAYVTAEPIARGFVLVALPATVALTLASRYVLRRGLRAQWSRGACLRHVVVVGHREAISDLRRSLARDRRHGLRVVGACLVDGDSPGPLDDVAVTGDVESLATVVAQTHADTVAVLSSRETSGAALRRIAWSLEGTGTDLLVAPGLIEVAGPRLTIRPVDGLPLLHLDKPEFKGARRWLKQGFDRSVALGSLLVLAPVFLLLLLAIRMDRCGPALYRQTRIGMHGLPFTLYKFRTMCSDAENRLPHLQALNDVTDGPMFKIRTDPRVTRFGRFLRKFSLDELPQLINVVRGEMSLVGPRPPLPREVESYSGDIHRKFLVKPGLTGLWQVSGRADLSWEESVRLDLRYVDNWSLALDLAILWRTTRVVLSGSGAY